MKMIQIVVASIFVITTVASYAQVVGDRTNRVHLNFKESGVNTTLPHIEWITPRLEYSNSPANRIDIDAQITSAVPLKSLKLVVRQSIDLEPVALKTIEFENKLSVNISQQLSLLNGQNYVEIIAENEQGGIVKDYRSVIVGMDAMKDALAIDRKDYALLFATDQYDYWTDLVNPIFDAKAIASELEQRYGFTVEIVENADQDAVFTKLKEYALKNYKPQDQLLIFFAGHGQYDDTFGEGFVVARNSLKNDPGKNSYISHNRLRNNINNIRCEHILLSMDVCFGGTFDPVLASSRSAANEIDDLEFLVKKLAIKTRKYLTSGGKEYVSDGVPGKHSPFTVGFLEALKSNGGEDRVLTLSELKTFMERLRTTPRFGKFGDDQDESDFIFIAK
ncbi:MAG: caspase family protein [Cyclobacteriaceae bacterium]|nr:caspase family protein [Cyclobacteriaceae bacterium]